MQAWGGEKEGEKTFSPSYSQALMSLPLLIRAPAPSD